MNKKKFIILTILVILLVSTLGYIYSSKKLAAPAVIDVSKQYQPICDLSEFNIQKKVPTQNFYQASEIPNSIKLLTASIVLDQSDYKKFIKKFPGSYGSVDSMATYPFTYISNPSTGVTTPLIPLDIIKDAKQDSIIVRYFIAPPGGWIPEDMPSFNKYIDVCHLKIY